MMPDWIPATVSDILKDRPHIPDSLLLFVVFQVLYAVTNPSLQWQWIGIYGVLTLLMSKYATTAFEFFKGGIRDGDKNRSSFALLAGSSFISWIFAKSINNASVLGAEFGSMGGVAYGSYYIAFPAAATLIYFLRTRHGYTSLPEAVFDRYGPLAALSFFLALIFRLYQEVWSNALVVADFYGEYDTVQWWLAAIITTVIPLAYVTLGGLRSSLVSDLWQAILAIALLVVLVGSILHKMKQSIRGLCEQAGDSQCRLWTYDVNPGVSSWSLEGGWDLIVVGLLQAGFSYPYFDPVLTDRAFLAEPKTMLRAFYTGGIISFFFIVVFGLIGVFGNMAGTLDPSVDPAVVPRLLAGQPAAIATFLGPTIFSITNIIFLTTSISTIDSTFASTAKISAEMTSFFISERPARLSHATPFQLQIGRFAIRFMAFLGILPLLQDPTALSATTVSGTMVMGLAAPMLGLYFISNKGFIYPISFLSSFWVGVVFGILYQVSSGNPEKLSGLNEKHLGNGSYGKLLWYNVVGTAATVGVFLLSFCLEHYFCNPRLPMYKRLRHYVDELNARQPQIEDGIISKETNTQECLEPPINAKDSLDEDADEEAVGTTNVAPAMVADTGVAHA